MHNEKILLGKKIKQIRKEKKITQEQLAELVGRSKNHISKIEQGCANPPLELLISIARTLSVSINCLFDFKELISLKKTDYKKEIEYIIQHASNNEVKLILKLIKAIKS